MKPLVALSGALLLAAGLTASWEAARLPLAGQTVAPAAAQVACGTPVKFQTAFQTYQGPLSNLSDLPDGGQASAMMENGWLWAQPCEAGKLRVVADGQVAGGDAPELEVALNSRLLWRGRFSGRREVEIAIPSGGRLTVGYFNDYYSAESRGVLFDRLKLSGACRAVSVQMPEAAGSWWTPESRNGGWLSGQPVTLTPCGTGTLHLRVWGRQAGGEYGTLRFQQGARLLQEIKLTSEPREVRLDLTDEPLNIRLVNPYYKELGDRNLFLRRIEFTPLPRP